MTKRRRSNSTEATRSPSKRATRRTAPNPPTASLPSAAQQGPSTRTRSRSRSQTGASEDTGGQDAATSPATEQTETAEEISQTPVSQEQRSANTEATEERPSTSEAQDSTNSQVPEEVVQMYQTLSQEWSRKPPNLQKCGDQLSKLKVCLLELSFLPTSDTKPSKQELLVARDILEIGAQWSIMTKDIPGFERYMAQLKCYYLDYKSELPESAYKYQLLGLNLLCLLSQTRLAEFHTELELLPSKEIYNNIYIKHPVSMEQYLMEGSYNKVFLAKGNVPAESYSFFIDILLNTIRDEIAACAEKAYDRISSTEAARILFFENKKDVKEYAAKRGWTLRPDHFFEFNKEPEKKEETIPANELASQAIEYARELEMIV
ncbi:26S proteasome non-ATPase regulatory subunit 8-like isoform X2 [Branchiostoma lanceolatum]|uniref:26S proteasome non-ATPase regulatory subunit 8-like isoform X2 n=1 Tax=Branchiostoma lanceolatum TaxID=7740 RepID=UPI0034539680